MLKQGGETAEEVKSAVDNFAPGQASRRRYLQTYGIDLGEIDGFKPLVVYDTIIDSTLTLVTTCQDLQDPMDEEVAKAYVNVPVVAVGPLLDVQGAVRAAGHKFETESSVASAEESNDAQHTSLAEVQAAKSAGRKIVLVSMGTVITGDSPDLGWNARPFNGTERKGLSGRELCQAAWAGAFDAFGVFGEVAGTAPLLVVGLGPQADALDGMTVPDNAVCMPVLQQVDLLKAGVDLFLTHGGQNSFTEALSEGVPVVVCPGFGDQAVNAQKAEDLGVGLQVERPEPDAGKEVAAAQAYRKNVRSTLLEVYSRPCFAVAAKVCAERLKAAGGVPRAVQLIVDVAKQRAEVTSSRPTLLGRGSLQSADRKTALPNASPHHART